ncbi:MAG: cysteine desulfurase-like protein [Acidobacteria bacterium]|nr:MAG: cysteine desulfurase-like protein [Acidobacteriota bacterium]PYQ91968.1 MAG: cysteine desulfurase-like protein [Acidobacteriota bacterium]PYR07228.1 MAG: cysteine desulfurase-like protein [Acidobacteriota bacterium]
MTTDEGVRQQHAAPPVDAFPIDDVRRRFPAIARAGRFIFFDNAAGAQVPSPVVDAVTDHLLARNVQRGGPYRHSREVDAMIARARTRVATFVNARGADEIAFGLNATSFIRAISLAVGQTLAARPEVVVSELDHEANVATWLALERVGARIVWWRVRDSDRRLHPADLDAVLGDRTRLVACTVASNATGTIVDVAEVGRRAHAVGAEVFLDAVHYAPHGAVDVRAFDCDYLVCSGYKIFAPHMGFAWCRREAINRLPTFREDFIPDVTPDKLEAGTYAYENVAGMEAAIEYLEQLGSGSIGAAMALVAEYERTLSSAMLDALQGIPGVTVHGVTNRSRLHERVPTLCFTVDGIESSIVADGLAARDVGVRSGHMYSPRLMARLGLMPGGAVRASLVHYNTPEEVERFRAALVDVIDEARGS